MQLVYLDTNFLVKFYQNKGDFSKAWDILEYHVRNDQWTVTTSDFALMEFVDVLQEQSYILQELHKKEHILDIIKYKGNSRKLHRRRVKSVQDNYSHWLTSHSDVITVQAVSQPNNVVFQLASILSMNGSIMAPDAVHLAYALLLGCNYIFTQDDLFRKTVNDELAVRQSALRRQTFDFVSFVSGAVISPQELDEKGRLIEAFNVQTIVHRFRLPSSVPGVI